MQSCAIFLENHIYMHKYETADNAGQTRFLPIGYLSSQCDFAPFMAVDDNKMITQLQI